MSASTNETKRVKKKKVTSALDLPDIPPGLPHHLQLQRSHLFLENLAPMHGQPIHYSGAFQSSGVDNGVSLSAFKQNLRVEVKELRDDFLLFDIIGIDAAIANALRRILISEVPTMAIEKVFVANNTSVIQDEVLAHRLGLVPIRVDPRQFIDKADGETANEHNTIVFRLHVKCTRNGEKMVNERVYSKELRWLANGSEWPPDATKKFTAFSSNQSELRGMAEAPPQSHYDDIVLAKLRPGQEIEVEAHCVKGIGQTHAKWSPVATASYKMLPEVILIKDVEGDRAEELVNKCPANVFDIEDMGIGKRARVTDARKCTLCRECVREGEWDQYVQLRRVKNHFIFFVESTGALPPDVLFTEAVQILQSKANRIVSEILT